MDTTCIITGIILVSPDRDEWVMGDLFLQGETLIVEVTHYDLSEASGEVIWRTLHKGDPLLPTAKALYLGTEFFERRGVFVVNREDCELSHEAVAYVMKQFASMGPWKKGA